MALLTRFPSADGRREIAHQGVALTPPSSRSGGAQATATVPLPQNPLARDEVKVPLSLRGQGAELTPDISSDSRPRPNVPLSTQGQSASKPKATGRLNPTINLNQSGLSPAVIASHQSQLSSAASQTVARTPQPSVSTVPLINKPPMQPYTGGPPRRPPEPTYGPHPAVVLTSTKGTWSESVESTMIPSSRAMPTMVPSSAAFPTMAPSTTVLPTMVPSATAFPTMTTVTEHARVQQIAKPALVPEARTERRNAQPSGLRPERVKPTTTFSPEMNVSPPTIAIVPGESQRTNSRDEGDPVRSLRPIHTRTINPNPGGLNILLKFFAVCVTVCVVAFSIFAFIPMILA